ncbi:CBS domain-containing protein [Streptococcus ovuberis]|uniref:CBS domain-containing protein n=1 Tax=Streptococcus ovuberis TaxID=1936207 RepID=A0A7X6MZD9_9STRE|nr:CBS domain-containing protein [Streptococcus ovuberis]NKZ21252.1 CBS domain-containing protein [Streptococcus ovuberis]
MAVKDFMTKKVVYVSPETSIAAATDLMRKHSIHRLPVIENDRLVGLVTEGTIAEASPSKATSLSIYEMNYLLNKTKVGQVMIKDVVTVSKYASLEDAIHLMLTHGIGVLPVVDEKVISGIITDKDVFKAFLKVSGYGEDGVRVRLLAENGIGVLERIVHLISEESLNISHTVNIPGSDGRQIVEVQIEGDFDLEQLKTKFLQAGFEVDGIVRTSSKKML